jgi:CheY-like chemotaxis protein
MDSVAKLVSSIASIAWPLIFAVFLYALRAPIKTLIESARGRKFTIKVAGNELTMEEASEQQRLIVSDIQTKLAELEKRLSTGAAATPVLENTPSRSDKRILWVDDNPKNNSFLVATLEERGVKVDVALSTEDGIKKFKAGHYDIVISDMGRPEGEKAGIDLAKKIRARNPKTPVFVYCGSWAARNLRDESLQAGVTEITSSGTTLLRLLPLSNES